MINLLESDIDIEVAKKDHLAFFECYIDKRLNGTDYPLIKVNIPNRRESSKSNNFNELVNFVESGNNKETIIIGEPNELKSKHDELIALIDRLYHPLTYLDYLSANKEDRIAMGDIHKFICDIKLTFDYTFFNSLQPTDDYSPYTLTANLKVRSCIFCNRTYTITRTAKSKGKLMRPQLDHWYPKSKFPLLAISFYNLIPCCTYCNSSVKGDDELNPLYHIHPYILETIPDDFSFGYYHEKSINDYVIYLKKSTGASGKIVKTLKELKIDQMYNGHIVELEDMINLKKAYSKEYIKKMAAFFPESGLSERETFRMLFGIESETKNYHLMPMSKFKNDILCELGIIQK